jgi:hypothetical protein
MKAVRHEAPAIRPGRCADAGGLALDVGIKTSDPAAHKVVVVSDS